MCNVGDRIYIFGGQLDLNANEDSGLIHVLETCTFTALSCCILLAHFLDESVISKPFNSNAYYCNFVMCSQDPLE